MELEVEARKLVNYINSLGLNIPSRKPSHKHVGAIIADAVMQIRHRYETHVAGRIARLRTEYPQAATVSGFLHLLQTVGAQKLLGGWKGQQEHKRLYDHARVFAGKRCQECPKYGRNYCVSHPCSHWYSGNRNHLVYSLAHSSAGIGNPGRGLHRPARGGASFPERIYHYPVAIVLENEQYSVLCIINSAHQELSLQDGIHSGV